MKEVYRPPLLSGKSGGSNRVFIMDCMNDLYIHAAGSDPSLADWMLKRSQYIGETAAGLVDDRMNELFNYHIIDEHGNLNHWLLKEEHPEARIAAKVASDIGGVSDGHDILLGGKRATVVIVDDRFFGLASRDGMVHSPTVPFGSDYSDVVESAMSYFGLLEHYIESMKSKKHNVLTKNGLINRNLYFDKEASHRLAMFLSDRTGIPYLAKDGKAFLRLNGRSYVRVTFLKNSIELVLISKDSSPVYSYHKFIWGEEGLAPSELISKIRNF